MIFAAKILRRIFWPIVVVLACIAVFLPGYGKIRELRDKNRDIAQKNRSLEDENKLLKTEMERIETDRLYREKILREKLGVVRKDEIPVKIIEQKP